MGCCMCEKYKWDDPQPPIATNEKDEEYCLFHAPSHLKEGKHEELVTAIHRRIFECKLGKSTKQCNLSGTIINGAIDFSEQIFPNINMRFAEFQGEANFEHSQFENYSIFSNAIFTDETSFYECKFNNVVNFRRAHFKRDTFFSTSTFKDNALLSSTTFDEYITFEDSKFLKNAYFGGAQFTQGITILKSPINGNALFSGATFGGATLISGENIGSSQKNAIVLYSIKSTTDSSIEISDVNLSGDFFLDRANIKGSIKFLKIHFPFIASFIQANIGQASFKLCKFSEPAIFDRTDLRKTELLGAPVENIRFMACNWPTSKGRSVTYDSRKCDTHGIFKIENADHISPHPTSNGKTLCPPIKHLEDLYRRLKKTARNEMDETLASDFHYAEKEMQRLRGLKQLLNHEECRHHPNTPLPIIERLRGFGLCATLLCYKLSSGYGEAPGRAALCLLLLAIAVPLIGLSLPRAWCPDALATQLHIYGTSTGDKWLHFLPLVKLPDADTAGWLARLLMLLSQVAITLQAALFGFALRNRFRR